MAKSPDKDKTPVDLLAEAVEAIRDLPRIPSAAWHAKHDSFRTSLREHPLAPVHASHQYDRELEVMRSELALRQAEALIYIFKHSFISTKL